MARTRHIRKDDDKTDINISPMIDMVFILLIFFIVTTVFVDEQGLDAEKPRPSPEQQDTPEEPFDLQIRENGGIYLRNREIGLGGVRQVVKDRLQEKGSDAPVIIKIHPKVRSGLMVRVMDEAKAAGAQIISVTQLAAST